MQGAGNDYVFVDGFATPLPPRPDELAPLVSDRRTGIGADGLIYLVPPSDSHSDVEMRMWNADGSAGAMCGNGVRCVALWMALQRRVAATCRVATATRVVDVSILRLERERRRGDLKVDMGIPGVPPDSSEIEESIVVDLGDSATPGEYTFTPVSMGNPHAVIFCDRLTDFEVRTVGAAIEHHERFADGVNVEWVQLLDDRCLKVRVWERGSGETMACGSGACAVGVAAVLRGFSDRNQPLRVEMPGGRLEVNWDHAGHVQLTGPAEVAFSGLFERA